MKIAMFGTGGVGGYYGARLAAAGEDVHFVARGAHLEAILKDGLRVRSPLGDVAIDPAQGSDDPAAIGPADVVFITVKLYDLEDAVAKAAPLVGPETMVVPLQNGVTAADVCVEAFGADRVVGGSASIAAVIAEPGVIAQTGTMAILAFGELDGSRSERTVALFEACEKAGIDTTLSDHIDGVIWSKFIFLASFSGITATLRLPVGPIRADAETRAYFERALTEVAAVARAKGVELPDDIVEQRMLFLDGLPPEMYASMYHDLTAGKRIEVPWLSGAVVGMGRALDIETPAHEAFWLALKLYADGAPEV